MKSYIIFILATAYALLPAYTANMAPVIIQWLNWLPQWNLPIDYGKKILGQPILGKGKTWRGLLVGIFVAIVTVGLQKILYLNGILDGGSLLDYSQINFLLFGLLAGVGALGGDILKSFIKRRVGINSGASWPVFDQLDFILGFFLVTLPMVYWPQEVFWTGIIITLGLHPVTNIIGYYLRIKKVWW